MKFNIKFQEGELSSMTQIRTTLIEHLAPIFLNSFNLYLGNPINTKVSTKVSGKAQEAEGSGKKKNGLVTTAIVTGSSGAGINAWGAADNFSRDTTDEFSHPY